GFRALDILSGALGQIRWKWGLTMNQLRLRPGWAFSLWRWLFSSWPALLVSVVFVSSTYVSEAQTPHKVYRVGHLSTAGRSVAGGPPGALRDGLRDLGYIEGQTVLYEARFAEGRVDRLPELASELVSGGVDVIVAQGGPLLSRQSRQPQLFLLSSPLRLAMP